MLVLGCKRGEKIGVGELTVTFLGHQGGGIRLGFEGPREVPVRRERAKAKEPKQGDTQQ